MNPRLLPKLLPWLFVLALTAPASRGQCLDWGPGFELPGPQGAVRSLGVFDDGSGPAMYAGGGFTTVEAIPANHIARWDGSSWTSVGAGLDGWVYSMCVFNDGSGPALYVGGSFSSAGNVAASNIARWNGAVWSSVGSGLSGGQSPYVRSLAVFDDGTGPALYAGGGFTTAGSASVNNVAKWNGSSWSDLAGGTDGSVLAATVFSNGTASALVIAGSFSMAGTTSANGIASWDGSNWSSLGNGPNNSPVALKAFDDGSGPAIYAGGTDVSRWNGTTWTSLGSGIYSVESITEFDDGQGLALYAVGEDGGSSSMIEEWNGSIWSSLPQWDWRPRWLHAVAPFDDGSGPALYFGGEDQYIPYALPLNLARWKAATWAPVGNALGMTNGVSSLAAIDLGTGPTIYAGGPFLTAGSTAANHLARLDGSGWSALGTGLGGGQPHEYDTNVYAITKFDDGSGPALLAAGNFTTAGGVPVSNVAKWNGANWSDLGGGLTGGGGGYSLGNAFCEFDDGSGPALYVGGYFSTAGGVPASNIAKWDGLTWTPLGNGVNGSVESLIVFDDGSGPALYVGGYFTAAGSVSTVGIARWNGSSWSAVGGGVSGALFALAAFNDGSGPALYAAGYFTATGCGSASFVARWNGQCWSALGNGPPFAGSTASPRSMATFDDGYGPALYVGVDPGCDCGGAIYKWDGTIWSFVTYSYSVGAVTVMLTAEGQGDAAPSLYAGMQFPILDPYGNPTSHSGIGKWRGCGHPGVPFCFGDGTNGPCPCGNSGAPGHGCQNSASTGGAILDSSGWTSLAFDSLRLTARDELSAAFSIFLQGQSQVAPTTYGDGLRCVSGQLKRLYVKHAVGGIVSAPEAGDPSISVRSAALGDQLSIGVTRIYQVYYRDPNPTFCPPPQGSTWNISNARRIEWLP